MKKVFKETLTMTIGAWVIIFILRIFIKEDWFAIIVLLLGFVSPIYTFFLELKKYNKRKQFDVLHIDLSKSIPMYCFSGLYECHNDQYRTVIAAPAVEYCICLVSDKSLHFRKCGDSLVKQDEFDDDVIMRNMDSLYGEIDCVDKSDVIAIKYFDGTRPVEQKVVDWIGNIILSKCIGVKNTYMSAWVRILYKKNDGTRLLNFGVSEKIVTFSSFLVEDVIAEKVLDIPGVVMDGLEFFQLFREDSKAIIVAKNLSNTLTELVTKK